MEYLTDLFIGSEGNFRIYAFLVTDQEPAPANYRASQIDIDRWKLSGKAYLSRKTSAAVMQPDTKVWLLVYEFKLNKSKSGNLIAVDRSVNSQNVHLGYLGLK